MDNRNGILVDGLHHGGFIPDGGICSYISHNYGVSEECCTTVCEVIRQLMLAGFCLLFAVGCNPCQCDTSEETKARASELSSGYSRQVEAIGEKQTETIASIDKTRQEIVSQNQQILDAVKSLKASLEAQQSDPNGKECDPASALEPQETAKASPSQPSIQAASSSAVRLYVTSSENCAPCVRLWNAVERGEFTGFDVIKSEDFDGLRSYPAIRFQDSAGQWKVLYGYDETTVETLRRLTSTNQFVSQQIITKSFVSHPDLVSIHNSLHGGGNWNWPWDLATHLRTVHGYGIQAQSAPMVNRGSSCPGGNCPTPRSLKMRWR